MKMFLRWVLISCLSACCIVEPTSVKDAEKEIIVKQKVEKEKPMPEESVDSLMLGWIEIEGVLSQGFVQGKDNREYLYVNADGTPSQAGANFLDYRCSFDSDNLIVYGHSSRTSEILFTPLMSYLDQSFAYAHDQIVLRMGDYESTYVLVSVFCLM